MLVLALGVGLAGWSGELSVRETLFYLSFFLLLAAGGAWALVQQSAVFELEPEAIARHRLGRITRLRLDGLERIDERPLFGMCRVAGGGATLTIHSSLPGYYDLLQHLRRRSRLNQPAAALPPAVDTNLAVKLLLAFLLGMGLFMLLVPVWTGANDRLDQLAAVGCVLFGAASIYAAGTDLPLRYRFDPDAIAVQMMFRTVRYPIAELESAQLEVRELSEDAQTRLISLRFRGHKKPLEIGEGGIKAPLLPLWDAFQRAYRPKAPQ